MTPNHAERKHKAMSASSAHRWKLCPGSVAFLASLPPEDDRTSYASEGTIAAEAAEMLLKGDIQELPGALDAEGLNEYTDHCLGLREDLTFGVEFIEEELPGNWYSKEGGGTPDYAIVSVVDKELHVVDLKWGEGIYVDAYQNTQGIVYAGGVLEKMKLFVDDDWKVTITIVQPRYDAPSVRHWTMNGEEFNVHAEEVALAASEALALVKRGDDMWKQRLVPGDKQCQWCRRAHCPKHKEMAEETALVVFDEDSIQEATRKVPVPADLLPAQIGNILLHKPFIEKWLKAVEEEALSRLKSGDEVPGYKLVQARTNRTWNMDMEADIAGALLDEGADAYQPQKLITIGDAEKILGKPTVEEFTTKPEGAPTLAPESDKRPALSLAEDVFDDEGATE